MNMANKFKVGDKVKCTTAEYVYISKGSTYEVTSTSNDRVPEIQIRDNDGDPGWYPEEAFEPEIKGYEEFLKPFRRVRIASGKLYIVALDAAGDTFIIREDSNWLIPSEGDKTGWEVVEVYEIPSATGQALDPSKVGKSLWKKEDPAKVAAQAALAAAADELKAAQERFDAAKASLQAIN
jgi:hypothetical protein